MDDVQNEQETGAGGAPPTRPQLEQGAIRGAFLARAAQGEGGSGGGAGQGDSGAATLRGAFMRHLTEKRSGAVVGDEASGDMVVRSIYAARSTAVAITRPAATPKRKAKAAPAKKRARAAAKRAQPTKRGPKKRRAAAPRRAAATRATTRPKKTTARPKKKKAKARR